jgi:hypothetical protein
MRFSKKGSQRLTAIAILSLFLTLFPTSVFADAGVPMLMLFIPGFLVLIVPIVLLEAAIARRTLTLPYRATLKPVAAANLVSMFVGVPLTWVGLVILEIIAGLVGSSISLGGTWTVVFFPLWTAWLPPMEQNGSWIVWAAAAFLCIPFFFVSVWVERKVLRGILGREKDPEIRKWAYQANLASYLAIVIGLLALTMVEWQTTR